MEELKAKIKEYGHLAAALSRQSGEIPSTPKESRERKMELMRQVRDALSAVSSINTGVEAITSLVILPYFN